MRVPWCEILERSINYSEKFGTWVGRNQKFPFRWRRAPGTPKARACDRSRLALAQAQEDVVKEPAGPDASLPLAEIHAQAALEPDTARGPWMGGGPVRDANTFF